VAKTKILMLSVYGDEEQVLPAIRAGAAGYVLKDTDREDFLKIIRHTHAGTPHASPYLAHLTLSQSVDSASRSTRDARARFTERYGLSDLELKILQLLTEGLNNEEISQLSHLARETIKGHLKNLFRKLDVKNRTEAAVLAVREGLDKIPERGR
jgi:DNA-binding NarL/FixJ family response regulator